MLIRITKDLGYFAATHTLPNHEGGCSNLHGHNYGVKVTIGGQPQPSDPDNPESGMVVDFSVIKKIYKEQIHSRLDHAFILGINLPTWYSNYIDLKIAANSPGFNGQYEVDIMLGKVTHLPIPETTAECLSAWIFGEMSDGLNKLRSSARHQIYQRIVSVVLTETETSIAEYTPMESQT